MNDGRRGMKETDRLEEIKNRRAFSVWEPGSQAYEDISWLIAEVESLRERLAEAEAARTVTTGDETVWFLSAHDYGRLTAKARLAERLTEALRASVCDDAACDVPECVMGRAVLAEVEP